MHTTGTRFTRSVSMGFRLAVTLLTYVGKFSSGGTENCRALEVLEYLPSKQIYI